MPSFVFSIRNSCCQQYWLLEDTAWSFLSVQRLILLWNTELWNTKFWNTSFYISPPTPLKHTNAPDHLLVSFFFSGSLAQVFKFPWFTGTGFYSLPVWNFLSGAALSEVSSQSVFHWYLFSSVDGCKCDFALRLEPWSHLCCCCSCSTDNSYGGGCSCS